MDSRTLIRLIKADSWYLVHTVGSYQQYRHPTKPGKVTVPHPREGLGKETLKSIFKHAGL